MTTSHPWLDALKVYTQPRVLGMLFLGFSAGLPLLLVLGTLSFWLREAGIDLEGVKPRVGRCVISNWGDQNGPLCVNGAV